ncbi:MAG: ABC transporter ATP-binding protein [Deltaproteobacteria bacterium]|nr:MAG: ABC transporter ATP-binding protein [Deltaproteobacteria bacterium]
MVALMLGQAALPAAMAWVGKLIVDAVVAAARSGDAAQRWHVLQLVGLEASLMAISTALSRGQSLLRDLMRASLGNHVNTLILEKATTLELRHFEDADFYDKMQNARREASIRPLSMALETASLIQQLLILISYAALLVRLSPWSVLLIAVASVPAFVAEAKLSGESFRLNTWRAPEGRRQNYLEWILTRDSHVKEAKLFNLGPLVLQRYRALFGKFYAEDRALALKKSAAGVILGFVSLAAFYGAYAFMAMRAALGAITLGDLTLYLSVFRQGQAAIQSALASIGSLYEDGLFMSNLFDYLDISTGGESPRRLPALQPARARAQPIEFRGVSFRYPGSEKWVLRGVDLKLSAGEKMALVGENGAGKSTLIKLLMRLYDPSEGAILYGGVDLRDMDARDLRDRIGVLFQDFVRYQFTAGENIGLGWVPALGDRARIERAVDDGGARPVIEQLPQKLDTMLGGWFEEGHELSGGQWQKIALARAFMRDSEVLVLDEPTAALDAEAEFELFRRLQELARDRTAILISHRFSTVRRADRIAVLRDGRVEELGTHEELLQRNGRYAHLFRLQASGYLS